jgi:hypothetical protein
MLTGYCDSVKSSAGHRVRRWVFFCDVKADNVRGAPTPGDLKAFLKYTVPLLIHRMRVARKTGSDRVFVEMHMVAFLREPIQHAGLVHRADMGFQ